MGGGGKSRKVETTQNVNLPPGLEQGANEVLAAGLRSAALPYSPNRGVTVAAFSPQQVSAMRGANTQAQAFGLGAAPLDIRTPEQTSSGIYGYSTGGLYDEAVQRSTTPEQREARQGLLSSFQNAAGRVYDAAGIDPFDPGSPLPGVPGETQPYVPPPEQSAPNPYRTLFMPGETGVNTGNQGGK